ncbi:hypothetical protein [Staphylococcus sp. 17KM0847]|uniref:hypothetical protein n=1 Tax=Staphylococcus sp. 17KM0847 TaxID=2583989 RepID=UPI0015DCC1CB|nr:hypothetical protein [Staphylococcus sp. 17KM0847]QLK86707.1 hypothetical protein FGL66_08400 [Staphylococcus sp. 17KM0847]
MIYKKIKSPYKFLVDYQRIPIPFSSHKAYFQMIHHQQIHALTSLYGKWTIQQHIENQQDMPCAKWLLYQRNFKVDDYDYSKDYFLNMVELYVPFELYINEQKVEYREQLLAYDITHYIHKEENEIAVKIYNKDIIDQRYFTILEQLDSVYIVERANDCLVDYNLKIKRDGFLKCYVIQVDITDIAGSPIPTYVLKDEKGKTLIEGALDIDHVNDIAIPFVDIEVREEQYLYLFMDTQDETLVHVLMCY